MIEYEFTLKFALPEDETEQESVAARLYDGGCDDALIGIGKRGRIVLDFNREAGSSWDAVSSALADVQRVIPGIRFIEAEPDLVGITDVAELSTYTRQNIRKIALSDATFPTPIHGGNPELFHLAEVLEWMAQTSRMSLKASIDSDLLFDIATINRAFNLGNQVKHVPDKTLLSKAQEVCAA